MNVDSAACIIPSVVRSSCAKFITSAECLAQIHTENVDKFLHSVDEAHHAKVVKRSQMILPLKFDSQHERLNFYCILHILNFGSGYRVILKAANGSGAFENITKLLISAHLSGKKLTSAWMRSINADTIGEMMRIAMIKEVPVPNNPILKEVKPSDAAQLVTKIAEALNDTGRKLEQLGSFEYLIDYVQSSINECNHINQVFDRLAALPILRDSLQVNGETTYIYKKAQIMLHELMRNGLDIQYIKNDDFTIFADNVIPTMLRHYELISCPSADIALASDLEITELQALSLRAASIVICEAVVKRAVELQIDHWLGSEAGLDNFLWMVAKERDLRAMPRYADRSTWFF